MPNGRTGSSPVSGTKVNNLLKIINMKEFKLDDQIWSDYLSVIETVNGNSLTRGVDYFYPGISEKICHKV